ncbi:hypothetical protein [Streptomyces sp. NPDC017095]|uniref:hypothetical protein n=1 Tax=Streptomyces sp. NPDC017095 TaxID=3364977 RepID=UPI0037B1F207
MTRRTPPHPAGIVGLAVLREAVAGGEGRESGHGRRRPDDVTAVVVGVEARHGFSPAARRADHPPG